MEANLNASFVTTTFAANQTYPEVRNRSHTHFDSEEMHFADPRVCAGAYGACLGTLNGDTCTYGCAPGYWSNVRLRRLEYKFTLGQCG